MKPILEIVPEEPQLAPPFSEEGLALQFAARHVNDLRHVAQWGRWMIWDGLRWQNDTKRTVYSMSRELCREAAAQQDKPAWASKLATASKRAAVLSLASDDPQLAATVDRWDADPWLLNTPGGVVDLRSGALRPGRPEDYITKVTAVAPGGDCPTWVRFLARVTGEAPDLQAFMKRIAGYALTGLTSEHALFFLHGLGANGKSVFISTVAGMMGHYHRTAAIETFTASHTERHPTELAMLHGARLVTATETEEGRPWAESRIKTLTGGDRISARFMRMDFFEFTPQFKLLIAGNHRPGVRSVDEAMRRRLHLVPFGVTIPKEERDPGLADRLREEWPGILSWAIEGCLEWQGRGLAPPPAVTSATADYLDAEDSFATWLDECCSLDRAAQTAVGLLYESWSSWADGAGERPGSRKRFSQTLEARGFSPVRGDHRGFRGIKLKPNGPTL